MASLAEGWGFEAGEVEYAAVGAGGYHWRVADPDGRRRFVTVHDLDQAPWLGPTPDAAFDKLRRCFDGASLLHEQGLRFVVAPLASLDGESARRLAPRYAISLFPLLVDPAGAWDDFGAAEREGAIRLLAELHRATPLVASVVPSENLEIAGREVLEAALARHGSWASGPYSEPAREVLAANGPDIVHLLQIFDGLVAAVQEGGIERVVTHGEPHGGNVIRSGGRYVLVDWDTVALAPAERDLMHVVGPLGDEAGLYTELTGRRVDPVAIELYRVGWDLADIVVYLGVLLAPHDESVGSSEAYGRLRICANVRDRWGPLLAKA